ncbi:MAG: hypothetical protein IJ759_02950 [Bacteroidales bacterium]|nr:hypothetical protein [Bacteroidales bacterium]
MKKTKIILFAIAVGCFLTGYSQAIKSNTEGAYTVNTTNTAHINKFIQKSEPYSKNNANYTVTLSQNSTAAAPFKFFLFKRDEASTVKKAQASIPQGYLVNDFTILGDTVIFVGSYNNVGYVAYFPIEELINSTEATSYINAKYTPVTEEYTDNNVRKVIAYKNNNGERIVLCLGQMYYGKPPYFIATTITEPGQSFEYQLITPEKRYHNYLLKFALEETAISPAGGFPGNYVLGGISGIAHILRYRYSQWADDEHPVDNNEEFHDIALTDSYVCLLSSSYYAKGQWKTPSDGKRNRLILRTFDRNTLEPVISKYMVTEDDDYFMYSNANAQFKALIRHTTEDEVAVGYIIKSNSTAANLRFLVSFIDLQEDDFIISSSQISGINFSSGYPILYDMEYDNNSYLWTLIRDNTNNYVFLLNGNAYTDYIANGCFIEQWCNANKSDFRDLYFNNEYMTITGVSNTSKLSIINKKRTYSFVTNDYFEESNFGIMMYDVDAIWEDRQYLTYCSFAQNEVDPKTSYTPFRYGKSSSLSISCIKNITLTEIK